MSAERSFPCVMLADRHHGLTEGIRTMLETLFSTVVMVADEHSLQETARRLQPAMVIADLSLASQGSLRWLQELHQNCPETKLIVLSVHDQPSVRAAAMSCGINGFVLTRAITTDLLPTIESVMGDGPPSVPDHAIDTELV